MRIRLLLPEVKSEPEQRPKGCKRCHSPILQGHGQFEKRVRDTKVRQVIVQRYRCPACGYTFRHYPSGVSGAQQSGRLKALASLMWGLGLSYSASSIILGLLEAPLSKMSVWRDVQAMGQALRRRQWQGKVRVIGADETAVRLKGREVAVGVVVDAQTGQTIGVDLLLNGRDAAAFERWLLPYVGELGVEVIVSDDLNTYKPVAQRLDLRHQVCLAHVRKNVTRRLREIAGWEEVKERLKHLLKELPLEGGEELLALEKEVRAEPRLKALVVDLGQKWQSLILHKQVTGVPATNNVSERGIGRTKVRVKTIRGFKSEEGSLNAFALTQWLYTPALQHDTASLLQAA